MPWLSLWPILVYLCIKFPRQSFNDKESQFCLSRWVWHHVYIRSNFIFFKISISVYLYTAGNTCLTCLCVVTVHALYNNWHTHWSEPVWPAVYTYTLMELKTEIETSGTHGARTHLERQNNFPCHKMTALEIYSILAFCKYSIWQWVYQR